MIFSLRPALFASAALAMLSLGACSESERAVAVTKGAVEAQTTPTLSTSDAAFINQAANGGAAEVQAGQLAARKASRATVRRFGTQMVNEHTAANAELASLAQRKGVTPPIDPDTQHQTMLSDLGNLRGRAFETAYLNGQVVDHEATLMLFQTEAQSGTDPELRAFAAKLAPSIEHHLEQARKLGGRAPQ